jgi:hypothetical protein
MYNYHLMTTNQVRDQHGNIVDPQVVHPREADDDRMGAAAKKKGLDERKRPSLTMSRRSRIYQSKSTGNSAIVDTTQCPRTTLVHIFGAPSIR